MRDAVMGDGDIEAGLGVVLSLAHATGSLRIHFERKELKERKARLKAITAGEPFTAGAGHPAIAAQKAVRAAVAASQAAVAATQAAVVASIAASSSS